MKTIKTKSGELLVVEVPKDVNWWKFENNILPELANEALGLGSRFLTYGYSDETTYKHYMNKETFYSCQHYKEATILGKLSTLTDEECEKFVEYEDFENDLEGWRSYKSYLPEDTCEFINSCCLNTSKESFISLLQSEGIDTSKEWLIISVV